MIKANASTRVREAFNSLIPGSCDWPSASEAVDYESVLAALSIEDQKWVIGILDPDTGAAGIWLDIWLSVESEPAFDRLRVALSDAYYTSPATAGALRRLAEASPRDPDDRFNPDILNHPAKRNSAMPRPNPNTEITLSSPPDVALASSYEHGARCGDFIYVAGQVARNENNEWVGIGDARAQAEQVYKNIGRVLAHFGAGPENVVKINAIMVDRNDRDAVTEPRLAFFGDHRPPHTGIVIAGLGSPEVKIEVEVVAYLPQAKA